MRKLNQKQKESCANYLAMAAKHMKTALDLEKSENYSSGLSEIYYTIHFLARASIVERAKGSTKHGYWNGNFNKIFGRGQGWLSTKYVKALNQLENIRNSDDYEGAVANDIKTFLKYKKIANQMLNAVQNNSPLCYFKEFIINYINSIEKVKACEFDWYCPQSYIHKERIQFQLPIGKVTYSGIKSIIKLSKGAIEKIGADRKEDYVLGWNNRLGQDGDRYLLFLDIDEIDMGKVKSQLKGLNGWLFKSGSGYHFIFSKIYGDSRSWQSEFNKYNNSKKLKDILDHKYYTFSIKRGYSTLRITSSPIKNFKPYLLCEI